MKTLGILLRGYWRSFWCDHVWSPIYHSWRCTKCGKIEHD